MIYFVGAVITALLTLYIIAKFFGKEITEDAKIDMNYGNPPVVYGFTGLVCVISGLAWPVTLPIFIVTTILWPVITWIWAFAQK